MIYAYIRGENEISKKLFPGLSSRGLYWEMKMTGILHARTFEKLGQCFKSSVAIKRDKINKLSNS